MERYSSISKEYSNFSDSDRREIIFKKIRNEAEFSMFFENAEDISDVFLNMDLKIFELSSKDEQEKFLSFKMTHDIDDLITMANKSNRENLAVRIKEIKDQRSKISETSTKMTLGKELSAEERTIAISKIRNELKKIGPVVDPGIPGDDDYEEKNILNQLRSAQFLVLASLLNNLPEIKWSDPSDVAEIILSMAYLKMVDLAHSHEDLSKEELEIAKTFALKTENYESMVKITDLLLEKEKIE